MIRPGSLVLSLLVFTAWGRGLHAAPDEVAFQPAGKLILVTGKINDQGAHNLIVDTGATGYVGRTSCPQIAGGRLPRALSRA